MEDYPFRECLTCKTLEDCPRPFVDNDLRGTPMPPDDCPRPIDIIDATLEKRKKTRKKDG